MNIFGFTITRTKAAPPVPVDENRGGWFRIFESFTGAWQQNVTIDFNSVVSHNVVFACMTLIASDISKLRLKLMQKDAAGIWTETSSPAFSPVLRKPNRFQTRIQFWENYVLSKLMRGNTYVLKLRDNRGIVTSQIVLAPDRVTPMISDDGSVFYQLKADNVAALQTDIMVPASEIIHDRFNCLFHPLVGLSPIFAAGISATKALNMQNSSASFFGNKSLPGGILTAPGHISDEAAASLKANWQTLFSGANAGNVAIIGDGMKYEPITMSAADSQMIENLQYTGIEICSCFHVPPYKVGLGPMPTNNNIQSLNVEYYSQCLQVLIESAEILQDEGMGIGDGYPIDGRTYGTEFDIDNLLRMDSTSQMEVLDKAKSIMTPNEQRARLDLPATEGGETVYRQQQDFSLAALAKRDAKEDPFSKTDAAPPPAGQGAEEQLQAALAVIAIQKGFAHV